MNATPKQEPEVTLWHQRIGYTAAVMEQLKDYGTVRVRYGAHAIKSAQYDRYGFIPWLPNLVLVHPDTVVELETLKGTDTIYKLLVRVPYEKHRDLVLVILPGQNNFVKTLWGQEVDDHHLTMDTSRYARPKK